MSSFSQGDFSVVARRFAGTGVALDTPAPATLRLTPPHPRAQVLLSVGVHGDETGPIEMLADLLTHFDAQRLRVEVLLVMGNAAAVVGQRRFVEGDLNRLFHDAAEENTCEGQRAQVLRAATRAFFAQDALPKFHFDLHTTIRPSKIARFAILPSLISEARQAAFLPWLAACGVAAVVSNSTPSGTYSYFSAQHCAAAAATLELGQVGKLGSNDLSLLAPAHAALRAFLMGDVAPAAAPPEQFVLAQQIIKHSADFRLGFAATVENFTPFARGELLAQDGARAYPVLHEREYVLFPNAGVVPGQRALLTVVPRTA